jgi:hypothetical protein
MPASSYLLRESFLSTRGTRVRAQPGASARAEMTAANRRLKADSRMNIGLAGTE